ncbi:MAG: tRNA pseudouridine(38-40) synthase [Bacteroidota bacterium]|jgi:tRNA pseudouridine38-40 synthase
MSRYALQFAYDGGSFHGYQIQPNAHSVQAELEEKLSLLLAEPIAITGSGRTDTGVHASHQIAHFDTVAVIDANLIYRLNRMLSPALTAQAIFSVAHDFHARFDATSRIYEYRITRHKDPFLRNFAYWYEADLDLAAMNEAAKLLLSHTDFQCFSKVKTEVNTFECTIVSAFWESKDDQLVFTIEGNRFLRGMVRAVVGTLMEIGMGKWTSADLKRILESKSRQEAGRAVPAHGLHLVKVNYPEASFGARCS